MNTYLLCKDFEKKLAISRSIRSKTGEQLSPEKMNFYRHRFQRFCMKLAFVTSRKKRSNSFKDEVNSCFVNEGKICRVKPKKQS